MTASPWAAIAGPISLPQWVGPTRVHRLDDEPAPAYAAPRRSPKVRRQAAKRPRMRCVPWALVIPGTEAEREILTRLRQPWPFPRG